MRVHGTCVLRGRTVLHVTCSASKVRWSWKKSPWRNYWSCPAITGDKIERAEQSSCTVCIARVLPGVTLCENTPFTYNDVAHWGVGKSRQ